MRTGWKRGLATATAVLAAVAATGWAPARADVVVPANPSSRPVPLTGDFTGDGLSDIALTGASGWTGISLAAPNNMAGFTVTYGPAPAFAAWASLPGVKIVTADFTSDRADDILLTGVEGMSTLMLAISNRNGTFTVTAPPAGSFPAWAALPGVQAVLGDYNRDGRQDVALAGGDGWSTIPVALSNGDGTFTVTNGAAAGFAAPASADGARIFGGDFDGDGRGDLALIPGGDALLTDLSLTVAYANGDGTFRVTSTWLPDFVGRTDRKAVTAGDLNGDSRTDFAVVLPDMILTASSRGGGAFDLGRGGGVGGPAFMSRATQPGATIIGADYDCDGRADLAVLPEPGSAWTTMPVAMPRGEETFFFVNDPMPHFPQWAAAPGVKAVAGDYNDDGCDDLSLTGATGWTTIPVALSNGDGSFFEQNSSSPNFAGWAAGVSPETLPPPPAATTGSLSILDTAVISGVEPSIAVGTDGLGTASYYVGGSAMDLRVAHCADQVCSALTTTDIDTVGDVGRFSSIRIGRDGLPLISYISYRNATGSAFTEDLKVAHCENIACTSATITTLDSAARVSDVTALTIGGDGYGLISYQDSASSVYTRMKVAHCLNTACTSATLTTIDLVKPDNGETGGYSQTGIATGNHGLGLISYYDAGTNQMLKVTACTNPDCSTRITSVVDRSTNPSSRLLGGWSSVTFGRDGLALISYNGNYGTSGSDLKVAHCLNVYCTAATVITADTGGHVGWRTSIAVGGDGLGVVSYYDATNRDLKVAHCANLACGTATVTAVDSFDDVGTRSSIATGTDGLPLIGYQGPGFTGVALRMVHCGNSDCTAVIVAPF